jgi:hypothetical protein
MPGIFAVWSNGQIGQIAQRGGGRGERRSARAGRFHQTGFCLLAIGDGNEDETPSAKQRKEEEEDLLRHSQQN